MEFPSVTVEQLRLQPVGLMWTAASFDEARIHRVRLSASLVQLGESETALRRFLSEQRKTQKRVNALKYNVIPRHRTTIEYIESTLSEEERNTQFQIRVLRQRNIE